MVLFRNTHEDFDALSLVAYQTSLSTGFDLVAREECVLLPGECKAIPTGLGLVSGQADPSIDIQIRPRSGLALKHKITVLNSPSTIDLDYEGEISVILINLGANVFRIHRGDRIAQCVIGLCTRNTNIRTIQKTRGVGGFGSTGKE